MKSKINILKLSLIFLLLCSKGYSQRVSVQYRFTNTPFYFSFDCANGSMRADNCSVTYHHTTPESFFSTDVSYLTKNFNEVDDKGRKLGRYVFNDDFSGYYLRFRDNKKRLFMAILADDFEEIYSDAKIVNDLIGQKTNKWKFEDLDEFQKVTRISNIGTNRQLGLQLQDSKNGKKYYMVIEVSYKFEGRFELEKITQLSYSSL